MFVKYLASSPLESFIKVNPASVMVSAWRPLDVRLVFWKGGFIYRLSSILTSCTLSLLSLRLPTSKRLCGGGGLDLTEPTQPRDAAGLTLSTVVTLDSTLLTRKKR